MFVKDDWSQNVWKLSNDAKSPLKGNWIYKYVIRMLCYLWIVQVWGRVDKENIRICILFIFPHRVLLIFRKEWHILNQDMKEQCREIFICWNHIFINVLHVNIFICGLRVRILRNLWIVRSLWHDLEYDHWKLCSLSLTYSPSSSSSSSSSFPSPSSS